MFGSPSIKEGVSLLRVEQVHILEPWYNLSLIEKVAFKELELNKIFVYAMAPFLSLRAIEQSKCGPGLMNLPICMISVGIGLGYADAGPTHYTTEDFACFRSIVGTSIYTPADVHSTKLIAKEMIEKPKFAYIRLDREVLPNVTPEIKNSDYEKGFKIFGEVTKDKIVLISHGKML